MKWKFPIPGSEQNLNATGQQFKTGFSTHASTLGYDAGDIAEVTAAVNTFQTKLTAANLAIDLAKAAVAEKNAAEAAVTTTLRKWSQTVKTNPLSTPEMFASMGIVPASPPDNSLNTPTDLAARPDSDGTCRLSWNANGNILSTGYVVEASVNGGAFAWLGNSSARSFVDMSATPGVHKTYRVRAFRAGETSAPSAGATIYASEEGNSLEIAA